MRMTMNVLILASACLVLLGCNKDRERVKATKTANSSSNQESKVEKGALANVDPPAHAAASTGNKNEGRGLHGSSAARMIEIMEKIGIPGDNGMGRQHFSATFSCHQFNGAGSYCTAGNKNVGNAKTVFKYLRKLGAREDPIDGRREGSEIDGTVECESSIQSSRDARCCLGNGCISS